MTIRKRTVKRTTDLSNTEITPLLHNEHDAARILGLSVSYLQKSRSEGVLRKRTPPPPHIKINGLIRYRDCDLRKWVADQPARQGTGR